MANVANSKHTGPASKDAVSGGKTFPKVGSAQKGSGGLDMGNTSDGAHRAIMGLRYNNSGGFGSVSESSFTSPKAAKK